MDPAFVTHRSIKERILHAAQVYQESSLYKNLVQEPSREQLHDLVECFAFRNQPEVSLASEGFYRLIWRDGSGSALCIDLLGEGNLHFTVFGLGKKFCLPDVLEAGFCSLAEIHEIVETHRLERVLGFI